MTSDKENRAILNDLSKSNCQDNLSLRALIVCKDTAIKKLKVKNIHKIEKTIVLGREESLNVAKLWFAMSPRPNFGIVFKTVLWDYSPFLTFNQLC